MENPIETTPVLFEVIKEFGDLSGFYINKNKTKIMCKNMQTSKQEELAKITGCEVTNKEKYLRVTLSKKNLDLCRNNYEKIWEEVQKDLTRWGSLNLSLLARELLW